MINLENVLETLEFDPVAFLNVPKCKGKFMRTSMTDNHMTIESGCLLTAFILGFGFEYYGTNVFYLPQNQCKYSLEQLLELTNRLANVYLSDEYDSYVSKTNDAFHIEECSCKACDEESEGCTFTDAIINVYDHGDSGEAVNLMWRLIEVLPKKKELNISMREELREKVKAIV